MCQERGVRADAHRQYLKPVSGRSNLTVLTEAKTLNIEFESARGQPAARGVRFAVSGPDGTRHSGLLLIFEIDTHLSTSCFLD